MAMSSGRPHPPKKKQTSEQISARKEIKRRSYYKYAEQNRLKARERRARKKAEHFLCSEIDKPEKTIHEPSPPLTHVNSGHRLLPEATVSGRSESDVNLEGYADLFKTASEWSSTDTEYADSESPEPDGEEEPLPIGPLELPALEQHRILARLHKELYEAHFQFVDKLRGREPVTEWVRGRYDIAESICTAEDANALRRHLEGLVVKVTETELILDRVRQVFVGFAEVEGSEGLSKTQDKIASVFKDAHIMHHILRKEAAFFQHAVDNDCSFNLAHLFLEWLKRLLPVLSPEMEDVGLSD